MYILKLSENNSMYECPTCWQAFIASLKLQYNGSLNSSWFGAHVIKKHLSECNAYWADDLSKESRIVFDSEEDFVIFKLRYGQ